MSGFDLRALWRRIRNNWIAKLFSVVFAVWLWAFVNLGERDAEKTLVAPVELANLPTELVITSPVVDAIDVRVKGPRTLLGTIGSRERSFRLDLRTVRTGKTSFRLDGEMLSLPRGVRVVRLSPAQLMLDVERLVERVLPVDVEFAERKPNGFRLLDTEVDPRAVRVSGPANEVDGWKAVKTQPVVLPARGGEFEAEGVLRNPGELTRFYPDRVTVRGRL